MSWAARAWGRARLYLGLGSDEDYGREPTPPPLRWYPSTRAEWAIVGRTALPLAVVYFALSLTGWFFSADRPTATVVAMGLALTYSVANHYGLWRKGRKVSEGDA